ncbi:multidrug efflux RND transporter permease subunit [Burkholderia ubonensis]|uniref:multidrug efflux RND transporter permease subunit n=1 Tax=Burkholderia ubonensis TaxID=101571 RepID=UPI000752B917|nr:multidrug efflux RND transporter permease subunit [Burkholderia ubonensis]KVC73216.1 multidrug transporter [Burkholderia ubonensis]KVT60948.1 multidrug transporter [Burkholderia ubonensis]KVZ40897.1 multidrug transporter [Burkholderia ubonensis]
MSVPALCVRRPVATALFTLGVALAGVFAFPLLPVSPLPQVDFPTISVQASLPGASPETMASTVATPLERQLGRIAGVTEMTSSSSLGKTRVTLQFDLRRDIDGAARDVQAAINAARAQLPPMPHNPAYRKVNPADAPIMILALTSRTMDRGRMYDAASTILAQKLSQLTGIGEVVVGGSSLPAVRAELNPNALSKYGIGLDDVRAALAAANANRPKGFVEDGGRQWQIGASDQAKQAADYLPLVVGFRNGAAVRLSDVADVTDSVEDVRNAGLANAEPAILLVLYRQPGSNIIETVNRVNAMLPALRASIPGAIRLEVMMDRTPTIRASLLDVEMALMISVSLVILVVFLFLRNARATLIPAVAVPVSLIGTFGAMYVAGYSLDNLSLMALVIATGFVVDDAIVVLENTSRHIEAGMPAFRAALQGVREVGFTVISMSLSLIAVFVPILLMGGIVGRLFREFAVCLSVAVSISLVLSLTTTPMMCARLLRRPREFQAGHLLRAAGLAYSTILAQYGASLAWALRHRRLVIALLAATVGLNVYLYAIVPKGFFPQQDTGRLVGRVVGDQSISFQAMKQKLADFMEIVRSDPAVDNVEGFTGGGQRNSGSMFVSLKPLAERKVSASEVIARLRRKLAHEPGASLYFHASQDIRMGGRQADAQYQFTLQADEMGDLATWTPRVERALKALPQLADVNTDLQNKGLQTSLVIDRASAARFGLAPRLIDATLYDAFGQRQVSTIYSQLNQYHVVMEVAPEYWQRPSALERVQLKSPDGQQVPLMAVARYDTTSTSLAVNHQGLFAASTVSFNLPPGVSLGDAVNAVNDTMARIGAPASVHGTFQSTARAFQASLESQPWLILAALVTVYIVLGVLYESYIHPLTILSTLPSAGVGALLGVVAFKGEFTVMTLIGVILLIGIVKKNAIMMVDFALDAQRNQGLRSEEAIFQACLLRFRPIMMTTMVALLGAVPLALGGGEGAELRQPLGISIVGGLAVSQVLTLYTTPVVYLYLDRFRLHCRERWATRGSSMRRSGDKES